MALELQSYVQKQYLDETNGSECTQLERTTNVSLASQHDLPSQSDPKNSCSVCCRIFDDEGELQSHIQKEHCGEETDEPVEEDAFGMRHTKPDEKFPCPECPFSANSKTNLSYHLLAHSGQRTHRCDLCEKTFLLKTHLKQHLLAHTGERPFQCELCDRAFSQKPHLTRHLLTHSGERPHACGTCGKRFISRSNLQAHELTHSEEKPFQCGSCGNRYHRASHLRSHVLHVHTKKGRPYVCDECGKGFKKECTLVKHREYHTKPKKKFQCTDCPYSTDNRVHMETHLLHHTGERPFPCDLCDKAFQRKDRLRKHLHLVHGGE